MGVLYLDSTEGSEAFIPAFQKLTIELDKALQNIKGFNIEVTDNEVIEGFHIEFRVARFKKYKY